MNKWLLVGYGNPDRQDDGVAWHILCAIAVRFGLPAPETYDDDFPENDKLDFLFCLQLTPELAEDIAGYERVCFVDAHTENIPTPVQMIEVESEFQRSPFTHHLTPQSLVSMCENLYGKKPSSALVSVRGYSFGFTRELSDKTAALVSQATQLAIDWLSRT
jgi:hydrogenase maturation protease